MSLWKMAALAAMVGLSFAAAPPVLAQQAQQVEREPEEPTVFPDGEHRDEVFYLCTACHGSDLVKAQGHSRSRWADVLKIMVERHNMAELEGAELDKVLDYLATAFPPKGRQYSNPFLKQ